MGWVSILEDAIERFEDELHRLTVDFPNPERMPLEQWRSAVQLLARGEAMLAEALKHLDLATDPAIDLAHALDSSVDETRELKRNAKEFQNTCFALMASLRTREEEIKALREEVRALKIDRNQLEKKLADAMLKNPAGIYEAFSKNREGNRKK